MTDPKKALLALHENMSRVIFGKKEALTLSLVALLGRGHLLIEDVPGIGKTSLARSIAQRFGSGCRLNRRSANSLQQVSRWSPRDGPQSDIS